MHATELVDIHKQLKNGVCMTADNEERKEST